MAFSSGMTAPLTLAMAALIVVLPVTRFLALIYVLGPMPLAGARRGTPKRPFGWRSCCGPGPWRRSLSSGGRGFGESGGSGACVFGACVLGLCGTGDRDGDEGQFHEQGNGLENAGNTPQLLTARTAGLIGCTQCGKVYAPGVAQCSRCGSPLRARRRTDLQKGLGLVGGGAGGLPACQYLSDAEDLQSRHHHGKHHSWRRGRADTSRLHRGRADRFRGVAGDSGRQIRRHRLSRAERDTQGAAVRAPASYPVRSGGIHRALVDDRCVRGGDPVVACALDFAATIHPGIAAVSFALSVAFTMISALSFDPRLIWDAQEGDEA